MKRRSAVCLLMSVILVGCSSPSSAPPPVEGIVTLEGKPLPFAQVMIIEDGAGIKPLASGNTDRDGNVKLNRMGELGPIPPGTYKVLVIASDPAITVSPNYKDVAKTPLTAKIPVQGKLEFKLEK